jgi:hypothetical protein
MFNSEGPRKQPCEIPQFTIKKKPKSFPILISHNPHSFGQIYFRFLSSFLQYICFSQPTCLSLLLSCVLKTEWDDDDLAAPAVLFFLAGFETTSMLLCFAAHQLATHPDVQSSLQEEIDM